VTDAQERAAEILRRLEEAYPHAHIMLTYNTPFQLLIAVMLSAQTTDVSVNKVTPELFSRYPTPEALAQADLADVERIIRPTGFFHNKAKNIRAAAHMIVLEFGGKVPSTMEDLTRLPGVARKTANIVLSNAFGVVDGIAVDTHVFRLASPLGLSSEKDPNKVERDLMALFPREKWGTLTYKLIDHGRAVCEAKRPACGVCVLSDICPSAFAEKGWRASV